MALHGFTLLYLCKIRIHPLIQGHYGLFAIYWVGLVDSFAFFSLHLFTTIGLGLLTFLLYFLFIYSLYWVRPANPFFFSSFNFAGPHLLGSILFLYLLGFLIPILLLKKGPLLLIFILNITLQEGPFITPLPKGPYGLPWALFFILKILILFRPSLGLYLCILFSLGIWNAT